MATILLTGGSGFFGGVLERTLLDQGHRCVNLDLVADDHQHPNLTSVRGDVRDRELLTRLCREHRFDAVFHLAAVLAHDVRDSDTLWTSNVDGTRTLVEVVAAEGVPKLVFTSSNCLWGSGMGRPVTEDDPPQPIEVYGRSKLAAEQILLEPRPGLEVVVFRCPTIVDAGRLGLLTILFEFIAEGRRVWVVNGGRNRYQFIAARDLADACIRALSPGVHGVFNVGSDDVGTFREVYEAVIARAGTKARVASFPGGLAMAALRVAHVLRISPLGPYHYRMIGEDFVFDTSKIKRELSWKPTVTNEQMLADAYEYWAANRGEIAGRTDASAHRRGARAGAIKLLKWLS